MIQQQLERYPRVVCCTGTPTPLEHLPHLSHELGREIYIKRDDMLGPVLGGNKARNLEYLIAEAWEHNARRVVTYGGVQSNHTRMTAAVARRFGLEPHLFHFARRPARLTGNLHLSTLYGAKLHFIPYGGGGDGSMTLETTNRLVHLLAMILVGRHYFIPVGGHCWRGCLGYVRAAMEIDEQARGLGIEHAYLVVAAGTGGTLAGLMAGLTLINSPLRPLGIDVGKLWKNFRNSIANMAGELCTRLDQPCTFAPEDVPLIEFTYVGERYGVPSPQGDQAIQRLARLEGITLDPIYTGKAFGGLIELIETDRLGGEEPVIFLHTGGLPGLFAFQEALVP